MTHQTLKSGPALAVYFRLLGSAALAALMWASPQPALAAGKPDKAFLESKFHMVITGLRADLMSRAVGNELYAEHSRDVRVLPHLLRYTQSVPLPLYDLRSSFDSVSELYYENFEHARRSWASEELIKGDMPWLTRFSGGPAAGARPWRPDSKGIVLVKDHVIVDGHEQGYKWFSFMRRKEGVSAAEAQAYMRTKYAPVLAKLPGIRRYVLGLTYQPKEAPAAGGVWALPQKWDTVDMIWFDSLEDMTRFFGSIDYQENVLRPAEAAVIDQSQTVSFATEFNERVPFAPRYNGPTWEEMKPAAAAGE